MRKKAIISLLLILIIMLSISGCGKKEKTSVINQQCKTTRSHERKRNKKSLLKMELIF